MSWCWRCKDEKDRACGFTTPRNLVNEELNPCLLSPLLGKCALNHCGSWEAWQQRTGALKGGPCPPPPPPMPDPTVALALAHQCPRTASSGRDAEAPGRVRSLHPCASGKNQTCCKRICFMAPQGAQRHQLSPFRECQGRGEFLLDELPMASHSRQPTALWSGCIFPIDPFPRKMSPEAIF